jgi:hypothetical protein
MFALATPSDVGRVWIDGVATSHDTRSAQAGAA